MRYPEQHTSEMRQDIRAAIHENRNLTTIAHWEARRAVHTSRNASMAAFQVIQKLERAREGSPSNAVPPN